MAALKEANYVDGYRLSLVFDDGASGIVDLSDLIDAFSAARPLKNIEFFKQFALDEWPTLVWPNGLDLSPEMLYERATGKHLPWLHDSSTFNLENTPNA